MSVATYDEGIRLITNAIGARDENPAMWNRIAGQINMWKEASITINRQKHTTASGELTNNTSKGMSGDSMVDESNTYWAAIQGTICGGDTNL